MIRVRHTHVMRTPAALYVGAGTDLPLPYIPPSHRLVCIDGQPFSEFGTEHCDCCTDSNCYSRLQFLAHLDRSAKRIGLKMCGTDSDIVRKYDTRVRYYTNTSFPEHIDRVRPEGIFTTLIVRGHDPHKATMDLLSPSENTFIGFADTLYTPGEYDDTVGHLLHTCQATRARFKMFTLVESATTRIHCYDWFDFVRHTQMLENDKLGTTPW